MGKRNSTLAVALSLVACTPVASTPRPSPTSTGTTVSGASPATGGGPSAPPSATASSPGTPLTTPSPPTLTEKALQILVTAPSTGTITVEVKDQDLKPVRTDLWFFKFENGKYVPLSGVEAVQSPSKRRSANFMLPRSVLGTATNWEPANDEGKHGVLTDGADRLGIDGKVDVKLGVAGVPAGTKVLIAAALEDQRYYGARVFELPSGIPSDAPLYNTPLTHRLRTYQADLEPLIQKNCLECHNPSGTVPKIPLTSYRDLVDRNFKAPAGQEFDLSLAGAERATEPGAPALSATARRTLPGLGKEAKKWYGKGDIRWNLDATGKISGDRRMPQQPVTDTATESDGPPTYFDKNLDEYKVFYDWVSQGALEK